MMKKLQVKTDETASDGYHTFKELYEHRYWLFISLAHEKRKQAWKSHFHDDGSKFDGMFIAGIEMDDGKQITYHLPEKLWCDLYVKVLKHAPKFDGHSSFDVIERLKKQNEPVCLRCGESVNKNTEKDCNVYGKHYDHHLIK